MINYDKKLTVSIRIKWPKHSSFRTSVVGFLTLTKMCTLIFSAIGMYELQCTERARSPHIVWKRRELGTLVSGCYRFQSSSHTKMLDQCISPRKCLTLLSGFLNGCIHSSRMALSTGRRVSMVILIAATEKLKLMWGNTMDFMFTT